ncbi:MAG TPA: hypothetical protein VF209_02585 [Patescibacteria group bacterium]
MNEDHQLPPIASNFDQKVQSQSPYWQLIVSGVIIFLLLLTVGYLYLENDKFKQQTSSQALSDEMSPLESENNQAQNLKSNPENASSTSAGNFTLVDAFARALLSDCKETGILADKLPINLTALLPKYGHSGPLFCNSTSSYVSLSGGSRPDFQTSNVYIFHGGSSYEGYDNPFGELATYTQVKINDKEYSFGLRAPGPYGISDLGLQITLIGQLEPSNGNLLVRSTRLINMDDEETRLFIQQFGEKFENLGAGSPGYIVHDPTKISQLENAIIKEIETPGTNFHQVFSAAAADIEDDFKLISPAL